MRAVLNGACCSNAKQCNMRRMAKSDPIQDAGRTREDQDDGEPVWPDTLLVPGPFAVGHDCELVERGGELCESCQQPACSGAVAVVRCDCGQLFRVNLLANDNVPHACPGCDHTYSTVLIICEPDNGEAFLEALAVVLRANGFSVAAPDDDDDESDLGNDDDQDDDEDPPRGSEDDDNGAGDDDDDK
jgi:hypothetical protein